VKHRWKTAKNTEFYIHLPDESKERNYEE